MDNAEFFLKFFKEVRNIYIKHIRLTIFHYFLHSLFQLSSTHRFSFSLPFVCLGAWLISFATSANAKRKV